MKQFGKAVLAVFIGVAVYDLVDDGLTRLVRRVRKKKTPPQYSYNSYVTDYSRKREAYSPEVDGRRPIGFRASSEE